MKKSRNVPTANHHTCPQCGTAAAGEAKFCPQCGQEFGLQSASSETPPPAPDAGSPPAPTDQPQAAPAAPSGELAIYDVRGDTCVARAAGKELVVGKSRSSDVPIPNDDTVSRQHCRIALLDSGEVMVTDLGSANGTWVQLENAAAVMPSGSAVAVGHTLLRVEAAKP